MSRRAAAALVASLLGLGACQSVAPVARPADAADPRWRSAILGWNERAREREALRGSASLAVDSEAAGVHLRSRQRFALERPDRLRVEVLGFLDQSLALLCIERGRYELFRAEDRSVEQGDVHDRLLFEQAMLDLRASDAIELLLGAPLLDPTLAVARAYTLAGGASRLDLADDRGVRREEVEFDADGDLVAFGVYDERGGLEWRVRFGDLRAIGTQRLPHRIELEHAAPASRAAIALADLELDPELSEDLFRLPAALRARARR